MKLKSAIKPFVPPIIWSLMSGFKQGVQGKSSPKDAGKARSLLNVVVDEQFSVPFIKVTQERGTYFVPKYAEHRPACRAIMSGGIYEPDTHELIDKILIRKSGSIVHAGTFFGDMLPSFARSCSATVYAFEPVLESYVLAKLCVESNNLDNVFIQNAGLSDKTTIARINTGSEDGVHHGGGSKLSDKGQPVGLVTIDSFELDDISIIQLDVEGHELPALRGARATIERNAPIILIEDNKRSCNAFLEEMGYSLFGTIPGLFVWAQPADNPLLTDILPQS